MTAVSKVLVLGSGAIGLRTALELLQRHVPVVLQSNQHPLHSSVCSQGAGGLWMPFHCDDARTNTWALQTLDELWAYAATKTPTPMITPGLVKATPTIQFRRAAAADLPAWTQDARIKFQALSSLETLYQRNLHLPPLQEVQQAGYTHAWYFEPPIVDCPNMLQHFVSLISRHAATVDVNFQSKTYESLRDVGQAAQSLGCDAVVNCAGLGARDLCRDNNVLGARGVTLQFDRSQCVRRSPQPSEEETSAQKKRDAVILVEDEPWGSETRPAYLIPRGDVIVLGGTYLEGDKEESIRPEEREQLMMNAERLGIDTEHSPIVREWTGFRPYRPSVRCELDHEYYESTGLALVHNYGHGGSGWTVNVGAAKEAVDILLGKTGGN